MINIGNNDVLIKLGNADVQAIYLGNEKVYPNYTPQYRWYNLDPSIDYYCSGTTKYYKQQYQISKDSGTTWENVVPAEYQMGSIAQCKSVDCGYVAPTTEWKTYTSTETQPYGIRTYGVKIDTANIDYSSPNDIQLYFEDVDNPNNYIVITYYVIDGEWHTFDGVVNRLSNIDENDILTEDFNEIARCNDFIYAEDVCNLCEIPTEFELSIQTQPPFQGKWNATYSDSHTESAQCDSSTATIVREEITLTDLVSVEVGDCVTTIGISAFTNATSLEEVKLSENLTMIDFAAFCGCSSLKSVTLPSGFTNIGSDSFSGCTSLESITFLSETPIRVYTNTFYDTNNCPIYVPSGSVNAYKAASGWSTYADRIQAIPNS